MVCLRTFETRPGHALAQPAFLEEGLFQVPELPVQQVVGDADQPDDAKDGMQQRLS